MKTTLYLIVSGLLLSVVGFYIAGPTVDYFGMMMGSDAMPSVNLTSDLRGMGGMLLLTGGYVLLGGFRRGLQWSALRVATLVFAAFVLFRSLGMVMDGLPGNAVMVAYLIELLLLVSGALLLGSQSQKNSRQCPHS